MPAADLRPTSRCRAGVAAVLLTAAVALAGCAGGTTTTEEHSDTYRGDITTVVIDFDDRGGSQIGTTAAALNVRLVGADRDGVQVDRTLEHTDGDKPEERIGQDGDTLTITVTCPGGFTIGTAVCQGAYEIQVPYGTVVRGRSHNGNLTAEGTRAATELRSENGDVTVLVAPGVSYAVEATSQDGEATVEVPQDPGGVPVQVASVDGDVTVRLATS